MGVKKMREITIKQALVEHYNKPIEKITVEEKKKFYSMVFPGYDLMTNYDLSETEKNQVNNIVNGS